MENTIQLTDHEALITRPEYLQVQAQAMKKELGNEQSNWYSIEAWLWNLLLIIMLFGFKVPSRVHNIEMNELHRWSLYIISLYFLSQIFIEPLFVKILGQKRVEKMAYGTSALLFILPLWWIVVTFRELRWLSTGLFASAFMCVVMYPHTCATLDTILVFINDICYKCFSVRLIQEANQKFVSEQVQERKEE